MNSPLVAADSGVTFIAIASGKGGVGKSTVTVNLATALAKQGKRVGIIDADVYGYSIPEMMGIHDLPKKHNNRIVPVERHGIKVISTGFFVQGNKPVVWRGPMLGKMLSTFLNEVEWGPLDFIVLDLPPGTGDIALDVHNKIPQCSEILVTTPHPTANHVAARAGEMAIQTNHPILGVIENMSYFTDPSGQRHDLFGTGGGAALAEQLNTKLLAEIPLSAPGQSADPEKSPAVFGDDSEQWHEKAADCVDVCPVDCIEEGPDQYFIDSDICIECGACEVACPMLKTKGELSAKEITEFIGITSMAVRRHINTLEKEGLIESKTIRQPMGRPSAIYRLTEQAEDFFPNKYHSLTLDLLGELEQDAGTEMVNHLFDRRGESLLKNHAGKMEGKDFAEKVEQLAEIQNENGYMSNFQCYGSGHVYREYPRTQPIGHGGRSVNLSSSINNPVTFITPAGTNSVTPDPATANSIDFGNGMTAYVRSANVTSLVQQGGAGTYTTGGVVGTIVIANDPTGNHAGWTLGVIYQNPSLPFRNMSIRAGAVLVQANSDPVTTTLTGFATPVSGALGGRALFSAQEGDANRTGDQALFGPTSNTASALSGPNNFANNFFASQINNDAGQLNTTGTFGTRNQTNGAPGSNIIGGPVAKSSSTTTAVVGDVITYTVTVSNTGTANANSVVLSDTLPAGLSFVSGSVTVGGIPRPTYDIVAGAPLGTLNFGTSATVTYRATVTAQPSSNQLVNTANASFSFQSVAGGPTITGVIPSNAVTVTVVSPALTLTKSSNRTNATVGSTVTYTILVANSGNIAANVTLTDNIPTGSSFVTGELSALSTAVCRPGRCCIYIHAFSGKNDIGFCIVEHAHAPGNTAEYYGYEER
ncbi:hypothetical protein BGX30_002739 [Mortierella sp. GBA39]|nr:hypothetical protein BGX30_002739 [Mortierella sp. GBA39]